MMLWRRYENAWIALIVVAVSKLVCRALGLTVSLDHVPNWWQYLDPALLRGDLLTSLLQLHSQPPLFNLVLGLALKAGSGADVIVVEAFLAACAWATIAASLGTMRGLGLPRAPAVAVAVAVAATPSFLLSEHFFFYPIANAALLAVAVRFTLAYARDGRGRDAAIAVGTLTALALTCAAYHAIWLVGALAAVAWGLPPSLRPRILRLGAAAVAVTLGLYAKNAWVGGAFAPSSWLGLSLGRGWPAAVVQAHLDAGRMPLIAAHTPFSEPETYAPMGYFAPTAVAPEHPAVSAPHKTNGAPNYNHLDYARMSRIYQRAYVSLIVARPDVYARRVVDGVDAYLGPGPISLAFWVQPSPFKDYTIAFVHFWTLGLSGGPANLLWLLFPAGLACVVVLAVKGPPAARSAAALTGWTVVWTAAIVNLTEVLENDRTLFYVAPTLAAMVAAAAWIAVLGPRRGLPASPPCAHGQATHIGEQGGTRP